ncbi:MAG: FAD-dependent thymidylate synthase [bacterium]|nr:FAD-dependent thymidylate synthase [bacterium]
MGRVVVEAAEALIDQKIPVLDKGFVRMVDYLGGDARIVQSARVSYGAGTKTIREDRGLIQYLYRNQHTSPFEQVQLSFHVKLPIFVARQWVRHRTARLNEVSGRYSIMPDEFYVPDTDRIRYQSDDNKQGSGAPMPFDYAQGAVDSIDSEQRCVYQNYSLMVDAGVARELARINLPLSLYTEWYWQIDLNNLFHFLALRLDAHAQYEIREYGIALGKCAKAVAPLAYEAFEEYTLKGARFGGSELKLLRDMLQSKGFEPDSDLSQLTKLPERRRKEFAAKLWGGRNGADPEIKPVTREEQQGS